MKNKQAGFLVPLLIAIVALLLIGGGAYVYLNKVQSTTSEATISEIQTSSTTPIISTNQSGTSTLSANAKGLSIYNGTSYKFSFEYPSYFHFQIPFGDNNSSQKLIERKDTEFLDSNYHTISISFEVGKIGNSDYCTSWPYYMAQSSEGFGTQVINGNTFTTRIQKIDSNNGNSVGFNKEFALSSGGICYYFTETSSKDIEYEKNTQEAYNKATISDFMNDYGYINNILASLKINGPKNTNAIEATASSTWGWTPAIQNQIEALALKAKTYYANHNNSYNNLCFDPSIQDSQKTLGNNSDPGNECEAGDQSYVITDQLLNSKNYYCIDSKGTAEQLYEFFFVDSSVKGTVSCSVDQPKY